MNKTPLVIILLIFAVIAAGGWYKYFDQRGIGSEESRRADQLAADYDASQKELNATKAQLRAVRLEMENLRSRTGQLQAMTQELQDTKAALEDAREQFEKASRDFTASTAQAEEAWEQERVSWGAERANWEFTRGAWDAERARWEAEQAEWKQRADSLQAELDAQRRTTDARIKHLTQDLATAQGSERAVRGELERLRAMVVKLGEHETMVKELSAQLSERDTDLTQMEARMAEVEQAADAEKARFAELRNSLRSELSSRDMQLEQLENRLTLIRVGSDILFETGSADITAGGRQTLNLVAKILKEYPDRKVSVEGHTDNVPIGAGLAARYPSNWELSAARAASAVRYLDDAGIDAARLNVVGHGAEQPVTDNSTAQARARNRRIEIAVLPADEYKIITRN